MGNPQSTNQLTEQQPINKTPIQWHNGELELHQKAGRDMTDDVRMMRRWMPTQHRDFFCSQGAETALFFGSLDSQNRLWASALFGQKGSVTSPTETDLEFQIPLGYGDPLRENLRKGAKIGMLGMEFHTRRRNRFNGTVSAFEEDKNFFALKLDVGFGNCPKYITSRRWKVDPQRLNTVTQSRPVLKSTTLSEEQIDLVQQSTSFWIASAYLFDDTNASSGADISHRGGNPGFVTVQNTENGQSLKWPDYIGNYLFNTLGNLAKNPKCGLLFIDFSTGATLHLTGKAVILHEERSMQGAQRMIEFFPEEVIHIPGSLPVVFAAETELSPFNPATSKSLTHRKTIADTGLERITMYVSSIKEQTPSAKTYTFANGLPFGFKAGQYATFEFNHTTSPIVRTWTLSNAATPINYSFSITVKKKDKGLISNWLYDHLQIGDSITMTGLGGDFTLEPIIDRESQQLKKKVLMVAAGVGITPMASMIAGLVIDEIKGGDIQLLYGNTDSKQIIFQERLEQSKYFLEKAVGTKLDIHYFLSAEKDETIFEQENVSRGRITRSQIEKLCPDLTERHVFFCGPEPFMQDLELALGDLKVPSDQIHSERFDF